MNINLELRIEAKTIQAEARTLRHEAERMLRKARRRALRQKPADIDYGLYQNLRDRRIHELRDYARAVHLSRAFFSGLPYKAVEESRREAQEGRFRKYVMPQLVESVSDWSGNSAENTYRQITTWMEVA